MHVHTNLRLRIKKINEAVISHKYCTLMHIHITKCVATIDAQMKNKE